MTFNEPKNILVIDDDETMVEALNLLLQQEGYKTYSLSDGMNAQEWFDAHHADLVLIDYLMPGETGASITKKLRQRADTKKTPIIMLAASSHYRNEAISGGVDEFIVKPFEIEQLLKEVHDFLD